MTATTATATTALTLQAALMEAGLGFTTATINLAGTHIARCNTAHSFRITVAAFAGEEWHVTVTDTWAGGELREVVPASTRTDALVGIARRLLDRAERTRAERR